MKMFLVAIAAIMALSFGLTAQAADKTIAFAYYIEHPADLEAIRGFKDGLKAAGIEDGKGYRFEYQSAQGSTVTASQIAKKFAGDRPDLIFAVSTPSAQAMISTIKDIPIVFASVTDPLASRLVSNLEHPGGNVSGSKDSPPIGSLLDLIRQSVPATKTIGVIYNAGEANSKAQVDQLRPLAKAAGLTLREVTVSKPSDVAGAAQSLVGRVDVVYVPNDGTVVSNFSVLNRIFQDAKIPVFATDLENVQRGALAGIGTSFYQGGKNAAWIAAEILKNGKKAGDFPVAVPQSAETAFNMKTAKNIGFNVNATLFKNAKLISE